MSRMAASCSASCGLVYTNPQLTSPDALSFYSQVEDTTYLENIDASVANIYGTVPLSFEANTGQADLRVQFLSRGPGYGLFLTGTEAVLSLNRSGAVRGAWSVRSDRRLLNWRWNCLGLLKASLAAGQDQLPGIVNYMLGNNPGMADQYPTFGRVSYDDVYPGIDLVYYGNQRQLEYDFVVVPVPIRRPFGSRFAAPIR